MRRTVVTVGPLATSSATNICASQKVGAATALVLNGTLATGNVTNNIAVSQSPSGAGNLTINGTRAVSGIAYLSPASRVFITSAGNDSGITFVISGLGPDNYSAQSEVVTGANTSTASSTNNFAKVTQIAVSGATAAAVTVGTAGTVATLDTPRRILITSAGDDHLITFTFTGTDWNGTLVTETITGPNATTAQSLYDYATITKITTSGATASTVTVGTNGVASSRPIFLDEYAPSPTSLQVSGSGTVNWTVRQTLDDPNATGLNPVAYTSTTWINHPDSNLVASTSTTGVQGNYAYAPKMVQLVLNSNTNPGFVSLTLIQSSAVPY